MKFFRYRRPSLKTVLGVTKAKKQIKKELGITELLKPFRWWPNQKRKLKRQFGYESELGRSIRDGMRKPGGCMVVVLLVFMGTSVIRTQFAGSTVGPPRAAPKPLRNHPADSRQTGPATTGPAAPIADLPG
jgi:hypothetical protein